LQRLVFLVSHTFCESLNLDLQGTTRLLFLIEFCRQVGKLSVVGTSEVVEFTAELLHLSVQVTVFSMRSSIYTETAIV